MNLSVYVPRHLFLFAMPFCTLTGGGGCLLFDVDLALHVSVFSVPLPSRTEVMLCRPLRGSSLKKMIDTRDPRLPALAPFPAHKDKRPAPHAAIDVDRSASACRTRKS